MEIRDCIYFSGESYVQRGRQQQEESNGGAQTTTIVTAYEGDSVPRYEPSTQTLIATDRRDWMIRFVVLVCEHVQLL